MLNLLTKFYNLFFGMLVPPLQSLILLVFRIYWGWRFFASGRGKLLNHSNVVEYFTSLGIPFPELNAWFVGGVECFGGVALMVGILSRPVGLILAVNMLVAYISVTEDRAALFGILSDPAPFLEAAPFFFLLTSLLVLAFGPGCVSLDGFCCRLWSRNRTAVEN